MKRRTSKIGRCLILTIFMVLACAMSSLADDSQLVTGTAINGIRVGGLTVEEAKATVTAYYAGEYQLSLVRKDGIAETISGSDIGYHAVIPDGIAAILAEQNASGRNSGPAAGTFHTMPVTATFDEGVLSEKLRGLACITGGEIIVTSNACISEYLEGQDFRIIPEVYGNSVDVEKLQAAVKNSLAAGARELNLQEAGCYDAVTIRSDSELLKTLCNLMNQCKNMSITYVIGDHSEVLTGAVITTWLTGSEQDQIAVNQESAAAYIKSLADRYDTAGTARIFHTRSGKDVELPGPYGWKINQEAETTALIGMIRMGQTQSREPQYAKKAAARGTADWGDTYVEIDLNGQHVYLMQAGSQIWDSPCVTGNVSKKYDTPPGIYSLNYKEEDRILKGEKLPNGKYEYESHVDFWMPFHGGIGLHDAAWRSKFGGTIYQSSGSHGCVNLPPEKAKSLYGMIQTGIPVICYN
ncbi:MAG: L,D-transpeptidase family protein [Hungatella sp.]